MATSTKPVTAKNSVPATTAARASAPKKPVAAAKPAAKPAVKAVAKPAAKAAPKKATSAAPKPAPKFTAIKVAAQPAAKVIKPKKAKMVRDSFTMPEAEYSLIAAVKKRCLALGVSAKKSEVLRAAIIGFVAQSDAAVTAAVKALTAIKTGRPPKGQK
jgi:hypothetical protein